MGPSFDKLMNVQHSVYSSGLGGGFDLTERFKIVVDTSWLLI